MPTIQRASLTDVVMGNLLGNVQNAVLIRICDPCTELPDVTDPRFTSQIVVDFMDVEHSRDLGWEFRLQPAQAQLIAFTLRAAMEAGRDVVVHCRMGQSRSAGVCEAAEEIGFTYLNGHPGFNLLVAHLVSQELQP